eukprot:997390-Prymnesium_polylepis.1
MPRIFPGTSSVHHTCCTHAVMRSHLLETRLFPVRDVSCAAAQAGRCKQTPRASTVERRRGTASRAQHVDEETKLFDFPKWCRCARRLAPRHFTLSLVFLKRSFVCLAFFLRVGSANSFQKISPMTNQRSVPPAP